MEMFTSDSYFCTADFPLANALAVWFPIEDIDRTNPRRVAFVFRRTDELEKAVDSFHRRELRIEPLAYSHAGKDLKARLYEQP